MKLGCCWRRRIAFGAYFVVLAATACGRDRNVLPFTWEASGVQVARLDLPLGGDGHAFVVREYLLDGQEGSRGSARQFRDRMVLTTERDGFVGPLHGYVVRGYVNPTYAAGLVRGLRLHGRMEPLTGQPDLALVIGRVYPLGFGGGIDNRLVSIDRFEIRLDPVSGRIAAKGL
jgi:hypothetical protein